MYKQYQLYLDELNSTMRYRTLSSFDGQKRYIDFSTNDYLNLSTNPQIVKALVNTSQNYGFGSRGSRLLAGNTDVHQMCEAKIALDKNTESALLFNSGFQANISMLSALLDSKVLGKKPIVFFDKFNHASLYQAIFMSKPDLIRYEHNNVEQLDSLMNHYASYEQPKFIVTETVFGMDGDLVKLDRIIALAKKHNAFLYLDEAHATGVFGKNGYGISTLFDLDEVPHVIMGTFSKALGCFGAYCACSSVIQQYFINKASGFIYSTSLPAAIIAASLEAWNMLPSLEKERKKLQFIGGVLRQKLCEAGFCIGSSMTHIVPIILKNEALVLSAFKQLMARDIKVSAIRPPTVPNNKSCIRIALTAHHEEGDIKALIDALKILNL